ncbi:LysR family transcriptional regulator [Bradyrhizobium sp. LTSPM299]|uniref:LysR substrate-binding domain-containing protein n=1 Tax=Bradyrhizobium sp. LTSPM299 TaxID=1619233 RepID=UPI0005C92A23|nr:LysR family transcriptional regulator [Bradyrhizobium sp. LTSPM299]
MNRNAAKKYARHQRSDEVIELRHLRFAAAAATHASFRKAADALLLRQSTLSRGIHQLEHAAKITIFERTSAGVRATLAGRHLLRMARSILEQMDTLITTAHRAGSGEAGYLSIGFYSSLSAGNLRATIAEFAKRFPEVKFCMVERSQAYLANALRNGTLDVAIITHGSPSLDTISLPLWDERVMVALAETHPLAQRQAIYWTDLRNETVLLSQCDMGREFQDLLTTKLASPAERPNITVQSVGLPIVKSLVSLGFGISLVAECEAGITFSGLTYREIRDGTGPSTIAYSAQWSTENDNPALLSFLSLLRERYQV